MRKIAVSTIGFLCVADTVVSMEHVYYCFASPSPSSSILQHKICCQKSQNSNFFESDIDKKSSMTIDPQNNYKKPLLQCIFRSNSNSSVAAAPLPPSILKPTLKDDSSTDHLGFLPSKQPPVREQQNDCCQKKYKPSTLKNVSTSQEDNSSVQFSKPQLMQLNSDEWSQPHIEGLCGKNYHLSIDSAPLPRPTSYLQTNSPNIGSPLNFLAPPTDCNAPAPCSSNHSDKLSDKAITKPSNVLVYNRTLDDASDNNSSELPNDLSPMTLCLSFQSISPMGNIVTQRSETHSSSNCSSNSSTSPKRHTSHSPLHSLSRSLSISTSPEHLVPQPSQLFNTDKGNGKDNILSDYQFSVLCGSPSSSTGGAQVPIEISEDNSNNINEEDMIELSPNNAVILPSLLNPDANFQVQSQLLNSNNNPTTSNKEFVVEYQEFCSWPNSPHSLTPL